MHQRKIKDLEEICKSPKRNKVSFHDYYSLGKCIKEYAHFPFFLHLAAYTDHAPSPRETLIDLDHQNKYRLSLLQNTLRINEFIKRGKKVYCTGAPFVHYRKKRKIEIKKDASGTVCFPFHSTVYLKASNNIECFTNNLKNLPEKFHPITICLHHCDIESGKHLQYIEKGFHVVSAGHKLNEKFVDRFYEILSNHKFATSNGFGSHIPYCIELGLPFFYIKDEVNITILNNDFSTEERANIDLFHDMFEKRKKYHDSKKLFKNITAHINLDQKKFAEELLGIHDAISPKKLNKILWREYFIYKWYNLKHFVKNLLKPRKQHAS